MRMRKLTLISLLALFLGTSVAEGQIMNYGASFYALRRQYVGSSNRYIDPLYLFMEETETELSAVQNRGTGSIFFVDSGVSEEGDGTSWTKAKDTIEEAYDLCEGNRGDVIYVAQGHAETLGTLVLDTEGVTIWGIGKGEDRPEITYDTTSDIITISAASNTLANLSFRAGVHVCETAINITGDGDYTSILGCDFPEPSSGAYDFKTGIQLTTGADYVTVAYNTYKHADAVGPVEFIDGGAGAVSGLTVWGNYIYGEFSAAAIFSDQTDLEMLIGYNMITNMTNNLYAIQVGASATGWLVGNKVATDTFATGIEAGGLAVDESTVWVDYGQTDTVAVPYFPNADGVARMSDTEKAEIQKEVDDALVVQELDSMVHAADNDDPIDSSIIAHIVSTTEDWSTFVPADDSLQSISDKITALSGIGFRGDVDSGASGSTTSLDLAGFGTNYFTTDWVIICTYDAGGIAGAPEGQIRDISAYNTTTGAFTHTAFTDDAGAADKVMIARRETLTVDGVALLAAPAAGSLANYIAGTGSLGTDLGTGNSLVDVLGSDGVTTTGADAGSLLGAIGTNELAADTPFSSSTAQADRDGSLIERTESIIEMMQTGTLDKVTAPADTYSILDILGSTGAVTTGAVAGSILGAIGTNELSADTPFSSSTVQSDADGSVLEREEWLQTEMAKIPKSDSTVTWNATAMQDIEDEVQDSIQAEQLDHLGNVATGAADMTTEVADGSVVSRIITSDADTSGYDLATDSQEAISDILWGPAGIAAYPTAATYANDVSIAEVLAYVQDAVRNGSGAGLPSNKSLFDVIGEVYTDDAGTDDTDDIYSHLKLIFDQLAGLGTAGEIFYVDSGGGGADSSGYGISFASPCLTIDYAEGLATASRGDIIVCAPGHAENITAAGTDLTMAKAGTRVVGLGIGALRPTLTFTTNVAADVEIDASCSFENFIFDIANFDNITAAFDIDAADVLFKDCLFLVADATEQAATVMELDANADRLTIDNCRFEGGANDGPTAVITFVATAPENVTIKNSWFEAECNNGVIYGTSTPTDLVIENNHIANTDAGVGAVVFTSTATGILKNNSLVSDVYVTALDPGSLLCFNNLWYDGDAPGDHAGIPIPGFTNTGEPEPGNVWYVDSDSGVDSYNGLSWLTAKLTIQAAVTLAGDGDTIYIRGITAFDEAVTTAETQDNVKIIGVVKSKRGPSWGSATDASSCLQIDGQNWELHNLRFNGGNNTLALVHARLDGTNNASGLLVQNCYFFGNHDSHSAIRFSGAPRQCKLIGNHFSSFEETYTGDYEAAVWGDYGVNSALEYEIVGNYFTENTAHIRLQTCSCLIKDNVFQTDGDVVDATTILDIKCAGADTDGTCVVGNYFGDRKTEITNANGYYGVADDMWAGNYCADGLLTSESPELPRYFVTTADMGLTAWNEAAAQEIAVVTGAVKVRILVQCTETLEDAANSATLILGVAGNTAAFIASTSAGGDGAANQLDAGEVWIDATPADLGAALITAAAGGAFIDAVIVGGYDIGYTIGGEALTDGILLFHVWWEPLDATGSVTVGAGGVL